MEILFLFIVILFIPSVFWLFCIKPIEDKLERQKIFWAKTQKIAHFIMEKHGTENAKKFIKNHIKIIMILDIKVFEGENQKKIKKFFHRIGSEYTDDESIELFLDGKYKEEDIEIFYQLLVEIILKPS